MKQVIKYLYRRCKQFGLKSIEKYHEYIAQVGARFDFVLKNNSRFSFYLKTKMFYYWNGR